MAVPVATRAAGVGGAVCGDRLQPTRGGPVAWWTAALCGPVTRTRVLEASPADALPFPAALLRRVSQWIPRATGTPTG
jgi:hypothetical protein